MKRDRRFLEQADADLGAARALLSAIFHDAPLGARLVEHCRAAAGNYLKAFLTRNRVTFPETAGLTALLELADLGFLPSDIAPLMDSGDPHRALAAAVKVKDAALDALAG